MCTFRFAPLVLVVLFAAPLAAQTTHTVTVTNFQFNPADLTINVGDTVVWDNTEGFHNVNGTTATFPDNPEGFGNVAASAPWTYEFTFSVAGDYDYLCDVHPSSMQGSITVNTLSSVEDDLPVGLALSLPTPNPFRGETAFTLTMATPEPVRVVVYDVLGREVDVLHDGPLPAGTAVPFVWAPATARPGAYLLRIEGPAFRVTRKLVLAR